MKKTKDSLLKTALKLFTKNGVANISIRQIAAEAGISHSNLIYHYPTKNDLINAMHDELLQRAVALNKTITTANNPVNALYESAQNGFRILYEYRFLMIDLNHILRENKTLHKNFLQVESLRAQMYATEIQRAVDQKLMRKELYEGEYDELIQRIKIFSDAWIASAEIYDTGSAEKIIQKYVTLFMGFFYPYLTEKGRNEFETIG